MNESLKEFIIYLIACSVGAFVLIAVATLLEIMFL